MQDEQMNISQDLEEGLTEWDFQELYQRIKGIEDRNKSPGLNAFNAVALADERYGLELGNHSLGVSTEGRDINIHYWTGKEPPYNSHEINVRISPDDVATRVSRESATGKETTETYRPAK